MWKPSKTLLQRPAGLLVYPTNELAVPGLASAVATPAPAPAAAPQTVALVDVVGQLEQRVASSAQPLSWRTFIVDLLKLLEIDSSLAARKELAAEHFLN